MQPELETALKWIVKILNKHSIPFQIAGGFGVHLYGGRRPINDIDIDIPNEKFQDILPDIKSYIDFGPARYQDKKWDLDLITLDYHGQLIDISGAYGAKIYDEENNLWQPYPSQFDTARQIDVFGITVPVMNPEDLMGYKKLLNGEHQKEDIKVMEKYILTLK